MNYVVGVRGYASTTHLLIFLNGTCRFLLCVGGKAANCASRGDIGWSSQLHRHYVYFFQLYHRLQFVHNIHSTSKMTVMLWVTKVICKRFNHLQYDHLDTSCSFKTPRRSHSMFRYGHIIWIHLLIPSTSVTHIFL